MDSFNSYVNNMLFSWMEGLDFTEKQIFQKEEGPCRRYFPNHCQICQHLDNEKSPLKRCSRCQLVSYCGKEHQAQDWSQHKNLCKVLFQLDGPRLFQDLKETQYPEDASLQTKILLSTKRSTIKNGILSQITTKLNRKPFFYELQLVNYPRVCFVCFESDPRLLKSCQNCPQSSYCTEHQGDDTSHPKICSQFNLARDIEFDKLGKICFNVEKTTVKTFKLLCQAKDAILPNSMKDFLFDDSCLRVKRTENLKEMLPEQLWEVYLSEAITSPLTLLYAMKKLNFQVQSNLVLHIIGSTKSEVKDTIWELILHWMPDVNQLDIVFIGPEVQFLTEKEKTEEKLCTICKSRNIELNFHFHGEFYQKYISSEKYLKANILAAYNAGLHAYPTWIPALKKIASIQCPFIVTSYSELQARQDEDWFKYFVSEIEYHTLEQNPFADFKYQRSPEDEKLFVTNNYLTIYDFRNVAEKQ